MANDGTSDTASAVTAPDFAAFEAAENKLAIGGEAPGPATAPEPSDPDADEQDAADAVADAAPAVEVKAVPVPTPEKPVSKRQQQINDLIRSRAESDQRAEKLAAEIAELKARSTPTAEPKPEDKAPVVDASDPEPQEAQYDDYRTFVKEQARWEIRQARREEKAAEAEAKAAEAKTATERELETKIGNWVERRDTFAAKNPEFSAKASAYLDTVRAGTPIGDVLMESEVGPALALHLATHPEEADRIARLAPLHALRALGKLEAQFESLTSASASAGPAARTVTKAPAPPMTLSARSADPADPVAAALDSGDYSAFEREENRRALASR